MLGVSTSTGLRRHVANALLRERRRHPGVVRRLLDRQRSSPAEVAAQEFAREWVRELSAAISDGQGLGYFGDRVNPAEVAGKILVLCVGYLALEPILPVGGGSPGAWGGEVTALLLRAIAW